ncbi:hypothetical protein [Gilvimarinus sp. DA14]|uniref:hypothetical protein n=1 Tax=Gilvimarinus sp. DA14 TaxID=2956798 RepID=UPI0020B74AAB|nr:hypothetical protein [Gilvimarinus sp. DA14]UTF60478.1 hypothetical protein NHM04_01400 [Gilvimarinus sp. DA14]
MKKWFLVYGAGTLGAFIAAIALWLAGRYGLTSALDVRIAPGLSAHWLYPRLVWGGLWGFLLLLPAFGSRWIFKALVLALVPTLVQLFVIYPYTTGYGVAGLSLGLLTPLVIYLYFAVWALVASITLRLA